MTYSQTISNQYWPSERNQPRAQRGLHKSVNSDDVWHSVWKRIENADPVSSAASRRLEIASQPPRDYVVDLDSQYRS
jgi:hypothetical protein